MYHVYMQLHLQNWIIPTTAAAAGYDDSQPDIFERIISVMPASLPEP